MNKPPKAVVQPHSARHAKRDPSKKAFCQPDKGLIDLGMLRRHIDRGLAKIMPKASESDEG